MEGDSQRSRLAFRRFEDHFSQHFSQLCPRIHWNFQRATRVTWDSLKDLCGGTNFTARTDSAPSAFTLFRDDFFEHFLEHFPRIQNINTIEGAVYVKIVAAVKALWNIIPATVRLHFYAIYRRELSQEEVNIRLELIKKKEEFEESVVSLALVDPTNANRLVEKREKRTKKEAEVEELKLRQQDILKKLERYRDNEERKRNLKLAKKERCKSRKHAASH